MWFFVFVLLLFLGLAFFAAVFALWYIFLVAILLAVFIGNVRRHTRSKEHA